MANLSNWYESKNLIGQKLVDMICNKTSFVTNEKEIDRFVLILDGYDINTAKQFEYSFFAEYKVMMSLFCGHFFKTGLLLPRDVSRKSC